MMISPTAHFTGSRPNHYVASFCKAHNLYSIIPIERLNTAALELKHEGVSYYITGEGISKKYGRSRLVATARSIVIQRVDGADMTMTDPLVLFLLKSEDVNARVV